jgi:endonuclease/exonuclease/phosphatase family metal-dependent hydrolase
MSSYIEAVRLWNILCWNIRGLNGDDKWPSIRNKIEESSAAVICLQETKMTSFDNTSIRSFAPKRFNHFVCVPSIGASGGLLVLWNSSVFAGTIILQESFAVVVRFTSVMTAQSWTLVNVYGPCVEPRRSDFVNWLHNQDIPDDDDWILVGDFNFYRYVESRNKPGGNFNDMNIFNDIINHLGLVELPIKGRAFTWSNMQLNPLLVQLDWFFTSTNWTLSFPNTVINPLARPVSDHLPCVINIGKKILNQLYSDLKTTG